MADADSFSLFTSVRSVRELLQRRLEEGAGAAQGELEASLQEIEALWEELRAQTHLLATERQRYTEFFEYAPEPYFVTDGHGAIVEANRAAAELLERAAAELRGKVIASFVAEEARREFRQWLAGTAAMVEGGVSIWRGALAPAQGSRFPATFRVRAMPPYAGSVGMLSWLVRRES